MVYIQRLIFMTCMIVLLASCATSKKLDANDAAVTNINDGVCKVQREWGGMIFAVALQRGKDGDIEASVDMSQAKWDVGVLEVTLGVGGKEIAALQAGKVASTAHQSSNTPAMVAGAGMVFDAVRGKKSRAGTIIGGISGAVMTENSAQKRRSEFDPSTTLWTGNFSFPAINDCDAKVFVRYWLPAEGVSGKRSVNVGGCFCH